LSAILLLLAFVAMACGFYRRSQDLRIAIVYATVPVCLFLVFSTEGLSVFHAVTKTGVAVSWAVFVLAGFYWARKQRPVLETDGHENPGRGLRVGLRSLDTVERGLLLGACLIASLVALTACVSAPNTWDAMEYHMPRVMEWIANRGVQLYPTIDTQQLSMPALSEYAILHIQLLLGSDRLANMVQWLAYAGSMIVVSLIARELGGDRRAQVLAAVVSGTIETGILGASGTKNDYVLAYWVAASVLLLLRWKRGQSWAVTLGVGSAMALAVFSKGTAYLFLPPLVVACFFMWEWKARRAFLWRLPVFILLVAMVSGPLWARNYRFSGSPLGLPYFDGAGPNEGRMFGNKHITPTRSLANVIRNVGLNLAVPSKRINQVTVRVLSASIRALGVDPNDYYQLVHSQLGYLPPFNIQFSPGSEFGSGNQLHFGLLLAAGALCAWNWRRLGRNTLLLGVGVVGSFVLYATMLRWSPWNARYQLPVFVVGAAFTVIVLVQVLPRRVAAVTGFLLLMVALPMSLLNGTRPILPRPFSILRDARDQTYFFDNHREDADSFIQAAKAVRGKDCQSVGIDGNAMHFEYPMMALIDPKGEPRRLSYVAVRNSTAVYKDTSAPEPCVVVCLGCAHVEHERRPFDQEFRSVETFGEVLVFSDRSPGDKNVPAAAAVGGKP
jgi:hypothetical protein